MVNCNVATKNVNCKIIEHHYSGKAVFSFEHFFTVFLYSLERKKKSKFTKLKYKKFSNFYTENTENHTNNANNSFINYKDKVVKI